MYAWLWRKLPGPFPVKIVQAVLLALAVIALLMFVIFPWLEPRLWFNEVSVN